jgi:hypothetical protein
MAAVLQEENKPGATELTRHLQAGERQLQTELGGLDELGLDRVLGRWKILEKGRPWIDGYRKFVS